MEEIIPVVTRRKTIQNQVAHHPLITFVVLAYAITWVTWPLNDRIESGVVNGFGIISLMGPALAAMIVSAVLRPELSGVMASKRWRIFGLLGILVLAVMAAVRLWKGAGLIKVSGSPAMLVPYPTLTAFLVDVITAAVVAFVFSGVYSSRQGVRDLLHTLDPRTKQAHWYWWILAVGLYPAIFALGDLISTSVELPIPATNTTGPWQWLVLDAIIMFPYFVFGGGGLEEVGWRGFALTRLQKHYSPLRSSLILAVLWAFWHWPFLKGEPLNVIVYLFMIVAPLTVLFTAAYNRTGGSLPIVILLHVSINLTDQYLPASTLTTGLWLSLILVIALWMWHSPQSFSFHQAESH